MTADQVHAVAVVGERANSGQRGRFAYTCGPHGVPQEYARCGDTERSEEDTLGVFRLGRVKSLETLGTIVG